MLEKIIKIYVFFFARNVFSKFNKLLYRLSLSGLGVLNYQTSKISGERAFLKKYLPQKKGVIIDVGANVGGYCKEAFQYNRDIKIFAFEPHPVTYRRLIKNLENYTTITKINQGLSSASGRLKLFDYQDHDGSSHASLFEDVITEIHGAGAAVAHEVELTTLDEFVESNGIHEISLLKIDTEGNELEVLKGAVRVISKRKVKAIHFEFNEMNVASRVFFKDFFLMLGGYKIYRLLPNEMLEIKKYSPLGCEIYAYQNIVAILEE